MKSFFKNPIISTIISVLVICSVNSCGTLGGIGETIYFHTPKKQLEIAIDSLYANYPEYKIPGKWVNFNDWSRAGYDFLESRIFYFNSSPEEMYYVTFTGDTTESSTKIGIGIRAIDRGDYYWLLEKDLDSKEIKRIEKRFDAEIVSKLERYTNSKAFRW